ncbi:hypothetical protein [Candidatus Hydrogenosomobacter endosymbioticus]|uniref:Uncharacterized protein n=1 Tax=Candidatus Hydrogenosomobacter endosymbioticus TaxID=2558174 RepID=A0ABN6L3X0_9PROT|nr:hypothetical protein [Candidatus Hydrogenosomobacter endosymbioticus]BDB96267.1 hypothetical protein HYD_4000 [Candidatus Hydrogenosomobacter endosymbioticus]
MNIKLISRFFLSVAIALSCGVSAHSIKLTEQQKQAIKSGISNVSSIEDKDGAYNSVIEHISEMDREKVSLYSLPYFLKNKGMSQDLIVPVVSVLEKALRDVITDERRLEESMHQMKVDKQESIKQSFLDPKSSTDADGFEHIQEQAKQPEPNKNGSSSKVVENSDKNSFLRFFRDELEELRRIEESKSNASSTQQVEKENKHHTHKEHVVAREENQDKDDQCQQICSTNIDEHDEILEENLRLKEENKKLKRQISKFKNTSKQEKQAQIFSRDFLEHTPRVVSDQLKEYASSLQAVRVADQKLLEENENISAELEKSKYFLRLIEEAGFVELLPENEELQNINKDLMKINKRLRRRIAFLEEKVDNVSDASIHSHSSSEDSEDEYARYMEKIRSMRK